MDFIRFIQRPSFRDDAVDARIDVSFGIPGEQDEGKFHYLRAETLKPFFIRIKFENRFSHRPTQKDTDIAFFLREALIYAFVRASLCGSVANMFLFRFARCIQIDTDRKSF